MKFWSRNHHSGSVPSRPFSPSGQRLHNAPTKLPQIAPNSASPDDKALVDRVSAVLKKLKAEPKNGIAAIADRAEIAKMGGNPQASFYVSFAANAYGGGFKGKDVPLLSPSPGKGTHGYFPTSPRCARPS